MKKTSIVRNDYAAHHREVVELLQVARAATARSINAIMTATYWSIANVSSSRSQAAKHRL